MNLVLELFNRLLSFWMEEIALQSCPKCDSWAESWGGTGWGGSALPEESTMWVGTFSGVTSAGMVISSARGGT